MVKLRRVTLPDGTKKLEVVSPLPVKIEERKKLREERNKKEKNYRNDLAKRHGFNNIREYRNDQVKKIGFKDINDYENSWRYAHGERIPLGLNRNCTSYLGVYIAESILPDIFENPEMMSFGNPGFDAICKKGYKVDVKSSTINVHIRGNKFLRFHIEQNKIADYFLLIAFDNRTDLNVLNMWLVKKDERLRGRKFNEFNAYTISVNNNKLKYLDKYKLTEDKIIKAKEVCRKFKEEKLSIKEE